MWTWREIDEVEPKGHTITCDWCGKWVGRAIEYDRNYYGFNFTDGSWITYWFCYNCTDGHSEHEMAEELSGKKVAEA